MTGPRLVLGVSVSIAAIDLPRYISAFQDADVSRISVVMTQTAEKFLSSTAVSYLVDEVFTEEDPGPGHVALAEMGDKFVMLPSTANLLACAANGFASSLLTTMLLAVTKPILFVPVMHATMWDSKPVQRNVDQLNRDGHVVMTPPIGPVYEVAHKKVEIGRSMTKPSDVVRGMYAVEKMAMLTEEGRS